MRRAFTPACDLVRLARRWPGFNATQHDLAGLKTYARDLGLKVRRCAAIETGAILADPWSPTILLSPHLDERNECEILGHELGHFLAGHVMLGNKRDLFWYPLEGFDWENQSEKERVAQAIGLVLNWPVGLARSCGRIAPTPEQAFGELLRRSGYSWEFVENAVTPLYRDHLWLWQRCQQACPHDLICMTASCPVSERWWPLQFW